MPDQLWSHTVRKVDPADIVVLVVSWHFNAASMGEYTHTEFVEGMEDLSCDSTTKLKRKLPQLRSELHHPQKFKVSWLELAESPPKPKCWV